MRTETRIPGADANPYLAFAAVIASAAYPAGEGHGLADVLGTQGAGVMGADHW